jgi:hypothetical protein
MRSDIPEDHAIVGGVPEDDRAVMERLAALEAEVQADADAQRARKQAALVKLRAQQQASDAAHQAARARQPARVEDDREDEFGRALALARRAQGVQAELTRAPRAGDKSWVKAGLASLVLGPLGWLYAGSLREAVPASAAWLAFAALVSSLPSLLLFPVLMVVMPLSGIAGALYAVQYNRTGKRQRLFADKANKQLTGG